MTQTMSIYVHHIYVPPRIWLYLPNLNDIGVDLSISLSKSYYQVLLVMSSRISAGDV